MDTGISAFFPFLVLFSHLRDISKEYFQKKLFDKSVRLYFVTQPARTMCVPRLQVAGSKQGNLGRYLFFEIGKQRDERHIIKQGVG
jgi:hypothetical protein